MELNSIQDTDDDGFVRLVNQDFQHNGSFEHPGDRRPEFSEEGEQRMASFFFNPVRAELVKPVLRFRGGETRWCCVGGKDSNFVHDTPHGCMPSTDRRPERRTRVSGVPVNLDARASAEA
jgi:hypothetical protein